MSDARPTDPPVRRHHVRAVVRVAKQEAQRRGDSYIGTEHLLLGVLAPQGGGCGAIVGIDPEAVRDALYHLDGQALGAVGIDPTLARPAPAPRRSRRRLPFTNGAKSLWHGAVRQAVALDERPFEPRHLLLAILATEPPDSAALLVGHLDLDVAHIRSLLTPVDAGR